MSSQSAAESANTLSIKYWLAPYAIVVSTLYLWGYWGSFHVNVLEYIGITDIVKAAVYPITSAFAFFAIGAVLGEVISPTLNIPPGGGVNREIGRWLRKVAPFVVIAYLLAITLYFLIGPTEKWRILPVLFAIAVYLPLKATGILLDIFKSDGARSIAVFLLAALIPFAYGRGVLEASDVLNGKNYAFAASEMPGHPVPFNTKPSELPRYVGKANDRYVFFDPVGQSILFIAASEVKALILKRHEGASVNGDSTAAITATSPSPSTGAPISAPASGKAAN